MSNIPMPKICFCCVAIIALATTSCARTDLLRSIEASDNPSDIAIPYHLPEGLVKIFVERIADDLELTIVDVVYRPDPDHLYFLEYNHSSFSKDTITVKLDSQGFLLEISAKSKDETGTFVAKIIELATEVAKAASGVRSEDDARPDFSVEISFDPTDESERRFVHDYLANEYKVSFDIEAAPLSAESKATAASSRCKGGACFRPALPYKLDFFYKNYPVSYDEDPASSMKSIIVGLPNEAPVVSIDLKRYAYVEGLTQVFFHQGMLKKVHLEKPSEAVGFMQVPIDIAKSIVSIPSALNQLKVTTLGEEKGLLEAESSLMKAQITNMQEQIRLLEAQANALENAQSDQ